MRGEGCLSRHHREKGPTKYSSQKMARTPVVRWGGFLPPACLQDDNKHSTGCRRNRHRSFRRENTGSIAISLAP